MQLPSTPPVVLAALLVTGAATDAPHAVAESHSPDLAAQSTSLDVADVPVGTPMTDDLQAALHTTVPRDGACPASQGPQCDSIAHEQYATGQALAQMGLPTA